MKIEPKPACSAESHASQRLHIPVNEPAIERTARIFRALGEPARIRLVARLAQGEACVTELAEPKVSPSPSSHNASVFSAPTASSVDASHKHGADCGHEAVPHGDHVDHLVNGHLHHPDGDHCDNHGAVQLAN